MPARWRGGLVALGILLLFVGGTQLFPDRRQGPDTPGLVGVSASAVPTAAPPASPGPSVFHAAAGFDLTLPVGWTASDRSELFNRRSLRLLILANGAPPAANAAGVIRWDTLPADHVVLELIEFSFPGMPDPGTESAFPLDWSAAVPSPDGQGGTALTLRFQHLVRGLTLSAHYGPETRPADRDAVRDLVASIRPERIPTSGVYRGWDVIGPLSSFPVGTVTHFDTPQSPAGGFFLVRGAHTTFAFIDRAYQFMGAMRPCEIGYDGSSRTFVCDATGERWSRTGAQLTGGGLFGLAYHAVFAKDGLVLVGGGSMSGGGRPPAEAAEFPDPAAPPETGVPPTKAEVIERYRRITTSSPIERVAAKLVARDDALASNVIRGAYIRPDIERVWVIAFSGDVRMTGSSEVIGRWTAFYADARTGGVITMACCEGSAAWPAGFAALRDVAPQTD